MNTIKDHIKQNDYKPVYLLYGTENFLKKLYRDKLKEGILGDGGDMNYAYFEGRGTDMGKVKDVSETMPFFADRRLIVIENSNWFKSPSGFDEYVGQIPPTTHIVFVESEVDKRGKMYKAVGRSGYASEMNGLDDRNMRLFVLSRFKKDGVGMTEEALHYFVECVGTDMYAIINESEKLACYCRGHQEITIDDIKAVCTEQAINRIFPMIDEIAQKNVGHVMAMYRDLLALREKPTSILFLIIRHFNILLQVMELRDHGYDNKAIASKASIPPFTVGKYVSQARSFKKKQIADSIEYGLDVEERVKTGRLDERTGVEMMITRCCEQTAG